VVVRPDNGHGCHNRQWHENPHAGEGDDGGYYGDGDAEAPFEERERLAAIETQRVKAQSSDFTTTGCVSGWHNNLDLVVGVWTFGAPTTVSRRTRGDTALRG
jgi:hypothetical protein